MRLQIFPVSALTCGIFLLTRLPANAADVPADGTFSGAEARPAIVDRLSVESGAYQSYRKNLQLLGFSEQIVQKIVTADVITAFAGKRAAAVAARYQNFKYWKADASETQARASLAAQRSAIDEEMNRVLQQLLGSGVELPDVSREWQTEEWNQELSFLNPVKLEATKAILFEYAKVKNQAKELASGICLTEDTNELQLIVGRYQSEQATLQQILSAEEFKQVQMTTSWTAENLRHALVHFEPTEEEFRIIFEAWQPHDENLIKIYASRQPDPGNAAVHSKIKAQLSSDRYEQYLAAWWK